VIKTNVLVIGAGPAGLSAAIKASEYGANVALLERDFKPGGQLIKQTHRFFGSKNENAGTRGIDIAAELQKKIENSTNIDIYLESTAQGYYDDDTLLFSQKDKVKKIKADRIIAATGAAEKMLAFPNNDLPGVYGAGAVQTLMNLYGVLPGERVIMIGAGNIGLIVSYQLLQAGVDVVGIVEAAPEIGGYLVHAAKIRRASVPIYTRHTVKNVIGEESVEKVQLIKLDDKWNEISGTEKMIEADTVCLAVGLRPLADILIQAGCEMAYIPQLGGDVPLRNKFMQTSNEKFYVAGDVTGIEEATAAILEGEMAGLAVAKDLGFGGKELEDELKDVDKKLQDLRRGPVGEKIRSGIKMLEEGSHAQRNRYSNTI